MEPFTSAKYLLDSGRQHVPVAMCEASVGQLVAADVSYSFELGWLVNFFNCTCNCKSFINSISNV